MPRYRARWPDAIEAIPGIARSIERVVEAASEYEAGKKADKIAKNLGIGDGEYVLETIENGTFPRLEPAGPKCARDVALRQLRGR